MMSGSTLYRLAAGGLIAAAAVTVASSLLSPTNGNAALSSQVASSLFYPTAIAAVVAGIFLVLCLVAVYVRQHASSGVLGLVGLLLIAAPGMVLTVGANLATLLFLPWLASLRLSSSTLGGGPASFSIFFPVASATVGLGGLVFGIAVIRARVFARAMGIGLIVCAVASFVISFLPLLSVLGGAGEIIYMVGLAWAGLELWRSTLEARAPEPRGKELGQAV